MPTAYSYSRFSRPEQAKGDSIRRQTQARDNWLAAHPAVTLDTTLRMTDAGKSGYSRDADSFPAYALAQFMQLVKAGRVPSGSYLLLENLDRFSREDVGIATERLLSLVNAGIVIVQLLPEVTEYRVPVDPMRLMTAVLEFYRANSESRVKSERLREVWGNKKAQAANLVMTAQLPGWVRAVDQDGMPLVTTRARTLPAGTVVRLVADEKRAELVREIYHLAISGLGCSTIARRLNEKGVPTFGRQVVKGNSPLNKAQLFGAGARRNGTHG